MDNTMVGSDLYCLKWNDFQTQFSNGFYSLYTNESLFDVTLGAGGHFVQAHKLVLAVGSTYFQQLFMMNVCKHPTVILKDVEIDDLKSILEFLYKGEVNVSEENVSSFLKIADMLKISGLCNSQGINTQRIDDQRESTLHQRNKNSDDDTYIRTKRQKRHFDDISFPENTATNNLRKVQGKHFSKSVEAQHVETTAITEVKTESHDDIITLDDDDDDYEDAMFDSPVNVNADHLALGSEMDEYSCEATSSSCDATLNEPIEAKGDTYFVRSRSGSMQLVHNGFLYRRKYVLGKYLYWYCTKPYCKARLKFMNGKLLASKMMHSHSEPYDEIEMKEQLQQRCQDQRFNLN